MDCTTAPGQTYGELRVVNLVKRYSDGRLWIHDAHGFKPYDPQGSSAGDGPPTPGETPGGDRDVAAGDLPLFTMELDSQRWNQQRLTIDNLDEQTPAYRLEVYLVNPTPEPLTVTLELREPFGLQVKMETVTGSDLVQTGHERYHVTVPAYSQGMASGGAPVLGLDCQDPWNQLRYYTLSLMVS